MGSIVYQCWGLQPDVRTLLTVQAIKNFTGFSASLIGREPCCAMPLQEYPQKWTCMFAASQGCGVSQFDDSRCENSPDLFEHESGTSARTLLHAIRHSTAEAQAGVDELAPNR
jgi:hypothetical protein